MNQECSHIAQWFELEARAKNFGLTLMLSGDCFTLMHGHRMLGKYEYLCDLRAGISDWVATQRKAGVKF